MDASCSICRDTVDDKIYSITNCKHIFHESCIETWVSFGGENQIQTCPMCRTELSFKTLEKPYFIYTSLFYISIILLLITFVLHYLQFVVVVDEINDNGICQWNAENWCSNRGYTWFKSENNGGLCNIDFCYRYTYTYKL